MPNVPTVEPTPANAALSDGTVMRARYFLAGSDLFQVMAVVPSGEESSNETNEFFNSFRLISSE